MARTIEDEQRDFDAMRTDLLAAHRGEHVLFKDGRVIGFYPTLRQAYAAGLRLFGVDAVYLLGEIREKRAEFACVI